MLQYLVLLGAAAQLLGIFYYVKKVLRGEVKPNKVSWIMWSIAPLIGTAAALASGVRWAVLPVFMAGCEAVLVLFVSFFNHKSYWKLEKFDYFCGVCSAAALVGWAATGNPLFAIIFSIISDGFAAVPTIKKAWTDPGSETSGVYIAGVFANALAFFAIKTWNFSSLAFPVYFIIVNFSIVFSIYRKRFFAPVTKASGGVYKN